MKSDGSALLLSMALDRASATPLHMQIYAQVRGVSELAAVFEEANRARRNTTTLARRTA